MPLQCVHHFQERGGLILPRIGGAFPAGDTRRRGSGLRLNAGFLCRILFRSVGLVPYSSACSFPQSLVHLAREFKRSPHPFSTIEAFLKIRGLQKLAAIRIIISAPNTSPAAIDLLAASLVNNGFA